MLLWVNDKHNRRYHNFSSAFFYQRIFDIKKPKQRLKRHKQEFAESYAKLEINSAAKRNKIIRWLCNFEMFKTNRKKVIVEMVFGFEFKKIDWLRIDFTPFG